MAGNIEISTPNQLTLTAGGCQIRMGGGTIDIKAPGPVNIHGSTKNLTGPASVNPVLPHLPQGNIKPSDIAIRYTYHDGGPVLIAVPKDEALLPK